MSFVGICRHSIGIRCDYVFSYILILILDSVKIMYKKRIALRSIFSNVKLIETVASAQFKFGTLAYSKSQ